MNLSTIVCAAILPLAASVGPASAQTYTFDTGAQGWGVYDIPYVGSHVPGGRPASVTAVPVDALVGLPAPALRVSDLASETWIGAPVPSLGARDDLYGAAISFDIQYRTCDAAVYGAVGIEGPTLALWISESPPIIGEWLHRSYPLVPGAWRINSISGEPASEAEIRIVLADLTGVYIHTEWKTGGDDTSVDNIVIGAASNACGPADIGITGGVPGSDGALNNNDFVVYIDYFFAQSPLADRGVQGGLPGSDAVFDNNDFIVFIDQFFAGC